MSGNKPAATSDVVRRRMSAQRTRHTAPEMALRRELHRLGLRYRLHRRPLEGLHREVDIVFGPARVAVDVRGCFWHACPLHGTVPRSNTGWWAAKLARNRERDHQTEEALTAAGWELIVVWEHEDPARAAAVIAGRIRRATRTGVGDCGVTPLATPPSPVTGR